MHDKESNVAEPSEAIEGFLLIAEMAQKMAEDLAAIHVEAWSKLTLP